MSPADEHRWIAGIFTDRVQRTRADRWDSLSPVEGWTARDVVRHLVEWFPPFLESGADDADVQTKMLAFIGRDPLGTQ